ncbi:MAG: beta-N-acetylhexosaminidase [Bacteroidetes bacterium]|nr:MAG: beta-N-acetylhexosaminidase [Bacteroidota bacterium]RLD89326.1 MAG: beta-N-acetylhexosaminidase [Bacteroidota bacterium]
MKLKPILISAVLVVLLIAVSGSLNGQNSEPAVIPVPIEMKVKQGKFVLNENTRIVFPDNEDGCRVAEYFANWIEKPTGIHLKEGNKNNNSNAIVFHIVQDDRLGEEGYLLDVQPEKVLVSANGPAGLFYGVQTIFQLLPPQIYSPEKIEGVSWNMPAVSIYDKPRFAWRGMHLDVSRHFFPKEFIKTYIDLIAMHKMNVFHWHLTDDNGWRIEIKKYPKLTSVSAWRVDREDQTWREVTPPKPGEKATYGGFYTQEDIREIVKYASERQVMILPEIEMPGHTSEVFAAYPSLSCSGKKMYVRPGSYWPNEDIFCAGNDSVFVFLEDVLDEVMELFPGPYIHIGGDEADKTNWKKCPKCRQRMKDEHLNNEDELQSWFIKRMENYLVAHGKKLIGWDEILEGGLAPEATVMSWRGIAGGVASARQGHDAVMSPGTHCYFDHYQADPEFEPEAIGGFTTLKKVYSYEPVPEELTPDEARHILGAQGNVWTEFIPAPEHAEYMAVPRMTALAEVVWSPDSKRNWEDFRERLNTQFERFDYMGINYSRGSWKVNILPEVSEDGKQYTIVFQTEQPGYPVYYTLDGSDPDTTSLLYIEPIVIDTSVIIKTGIFDHGELKEKYAEKSIIFHKALGKKTKLEVQPVKKYSGKGAQTLVDGMTGSARYNDGYWLGFDGTDLDFTVDMEEEVPVQQVTVNFYQRQSFWIFMPVEVIIQVLDESGKIAASQTVLPKTDPKSEETVIEAFKVKFDHVKGQYVRVVGKNCGNCPAWHKGAGDTCWIFSDEVIVK